ncbi:hypothetical protein ARMSODRAFT_227245 [Armillaria solidipes]|uniref:Uncharacterized protein n=1 Tax=Armillaria solidipes TaxID=1076256 RepID=A0A2H3C3J5_9AGAR|nr:hypothetical protein ARMSODRAFT_227245 [Armillaria solidipes]
MYKDWVLVRRLPEEADEINQRIAENIQQVTEENQEYIRSYHPAFKEASSVFVYFNPSSLSESVWIVHPAFARRNTFLLDNLSVAGREVHPFEYISPLPRTESTLLVHSSYNPYRDDPLRNLNPRVPLSKDDISVIRELWPSIIGVRIYVCGAISLLVHSWADISKVTKYGWPSTIGGLLAQIESVEEIKLSVDRTPYALQDGPQRHSHTGTNRIGSTGLRIRGRFGPDENTVSDAIMTDTHSFVYTPSGITRHIFYDQDSRRVDKGLPCTM